MFVSILHADADAFFASVEQRDDPALRDRPLIVGEGVVMAASYEARARGVHGGMHGARARRLCPDAVIVPARFEAYVEASRALFAVFDRTAPVVEGLSLEEAFLDVRGLERISGTPRAIAARLRSDVREEVGLAVTVGVARTRLLAKMASRAAKPDGLLELARADETAFLHPLAVEALWGVGEKSARKLHARGIRTVADAAARSETDLIAHPGPLGRRLPPRRRAPPRGPGGAAAAAPAQLRRAARARPRAARRRRARRRPARARRPGHAADARRRADRQDADAARPLRRLHARVARADAAGAHRRPRRRDRRRARAAGRRGPLVARRGCTLLGLSVGNLAEAPAQLALPLDGGPPATDAAIDAVRDRFGDAKLTRATLLNRGPELIPRP